MKKSLTLFLSVVCLVSLSSCGLFSGGQSSSKPTLIGKATPVTPEFLAAVKALFPQGLAPGYYLCAQNPPYTSDTSLFNYPIQLFSPVTDKQVVITTQMDKVNNTNICQLSVDLQKVAISYNKSSSSSLGASSDRSYLAIFDRQGNQLFGTDSQVDGYSSDLKYLAYLDSSNNEHVISTLTGKEVSASVPSGYSFSGFTGDSAIFVNTNGESIVLNLDTQQQAKYSKGIIIPLSQIVKDKVYYMDFPPDSNFVLPTAFYSSNLDGTDKKLLANCTDASISPDGNYLAYEVLYGEGMDPSSPLPGNPKEGLFLKNLQSEAIIYYGYPIRS